VTRIVRSYDANGRIIEETQFQENLILMFTDQSGTEGQPQPTAAQLEGMNRHLQSLLGGKNGPKISYSYDAQGRVTEMRTHNIMFDKVTTTSYNENGDKSAEVETMTQNSSAPVGGTFSMDENGTFIQTGPAAKPTEFPAELLHETKVSYAYEYDSYGNWTRLTMNYSSGFGEMPSTFHR
jgi:hypothetical protein